VRDDLGWAAMPAVSDPALRDWLESAACGPHVKAVAALAIQASAEGCSAAQWRRDLLAEHPGAAKLVAEAETCMRSSGLWPWPGAGGVVT
jgi:hypothetical protein